MEFRAEIKRTLTGPDKLRAVCSVILDDCFLVKNVRVVEGEKGMFVSLPSRRNVRGEWTEQCFPMTKELREKLSAVVLAVLKSWQTLRLTAPMLCVWGLSVLAPVSWLVLSKAHSDIHSHLIPVLFQFSAVPASAAMLAVLLMVWLRLGFGKVRGK